MAARASCELSVGCPSSVLTEEAEVAEAQIPTENRINVNKNARLMPRGRERIVLQVESGQTPEGVAQAVGVCPRSCLRRPNRSENSRRPPHEPHDNALTLFEIIGTFWVPRRRWVIPKGWPKKGKSPQYSAAREAFEEAGVLGSVAKRSVGSFSYEKRLRSGAVVVCDVRVFPLQVRRQSRQWPE